MNATETISRHIEVVRTADPVPYAEACQAQKARRTAVEAGRMGNTLFLLEHAPTITLGRNTRREHLLCTREELTEMGIELHEAERGGDVTYHGPGQLVAYPIMNLRLWRPSIRWYLRSLEEILIRTLGACGLRGERVAGLTGVWVDGAKIASIGIGIHNWVAFHGVALNVNPDMDHFRLVVPCGIADKSITSMAQLLGDSPAISDVMDIFEQCFLDYFAAYPGSDNAKH